MIGEIDLPGWYWWGVALGWIALGVITDLDHPWLSAVRGLALTKPACLVETRAAGLLLLLYTALPCPEGRAGGSPPVARPSRSRH